MRRRNDPDLAVHRGPDRRELLARSAHGFGALALLALGPPQARTAPDEPRRPHHRPRARSVIFLYQDGGPSQVDTFDPKPRLQREDGQPFRMRMERTQFEDNGVTLGSPWKFRRYGESGLPVSDLYPNVGRHADRLCVVRSATSKFSEHTNANYFLHTGHGLAGRPSIGAWAVYGLGLMNRDLPGFIVLNGGLTPPGGLDCFGSGFLPATYQGSRFRPQDPALANLKPPGDAKEAQRRKLDLLGALDAADGALGESDGVRAAIRNYELAFRMQSAVPELMDLSGESALTRELYGFDHPFAPARTYARQCLLARRMVERGVRFIELTCPRVSGADRWDQHSNLKKCHAQNALATDQPIAALLTDLEARGLLEETLVVWMGEFGRTPFAQGRGAGAGRDHNPFGYSFWMAGGGVRGGHVHGETDEYGYHAVAGRVEIHDVHATLLHLLGFGHTRLHYRWSGRDMRLTDVHGRVLHELLA